jgi:hypothetical protein
VGGGVFLSDAKRGEKYVERDEKKWKIEKKKKERDKMNGKWEEEKVKFRKERW